MLSFSVNIFICALSIVLTASYAAIGLEPSQPQQKILNKCHDETPETLTQKKCHSSVRYLMMTEGQLLDHISYDNRISFDTFHKLIVFVNEKRQHLKHYLRAECGLTDNHGQDVSWY